MESKSVKVSYVEFTDLKEAMENKNYPESGFYVVKISEDNSDLRFIDKSSKLNFCICPESVFNGVEKYAVIPPQQLEVIPEYEVLPSQSMSDNSFILEFSKILLNKK